MKDETQSTEERSFLISRQKHEFFQFYDESISGSPVPIRLNGRELATHMNHMSHKAWTKKKKKVTIQILSKLKNLVLQYNQFKMTRASYALRYFFNIQNIPSFFSIKLWIVPKTEVMQ